MTIKPLPNPWYRPDPWRTFSHVFWYAGYCLACELGVES